MNPDKDTAVISGNVEKLQQNYRQLARLLPILLRDQPAVLAEAEHHLACSLRILGRMQERFRDWPEGEKPAAGPRPPPACDERAK